MVLGIIIVALGLFTHIDSEWRIANQRVTLQQRLLYMYGRAADGVHLLRLKSTSSLSTSSASFYH
ncbi:hypothetical protein Ocin01_20169 [Orchesella cincta]|uniref:Uncharacterized protein n=1 Tax=Orchesella cincta TaxID=48709 RepID=A0A1D2M0M6_ORCCI|nr:hypothetical protein Ocin01_20169 [Orchesella cincta]